MDDPRGYFDYVNRKICPLSTSTWDGLSGTTWADWTEWAYATEDTIIWMIDDYFVANTPEPYNLKITCVSTGEVSYKVYASSNGAFNGEETETVISHTATNVPVFRSRFLRVIVYSTRVNNITPEISEITLELVKSATKDLIINDLDTSTLEGTQTARVIALPEPVGNIIDIKVTPRETASPYALDVYVTNTATSTYLIPKVISKSATAPTIALVGVDNHPRDGVVDVVIKTMPNSYMNGNNLVLG